jgi:ATP-dependent protease HslVU (ClpYQ) peptidase subunit
MTCIVGVAHKGGVTIGGDSAGVGGLSLTVRKDPKVFRNGPCLIGFTSSFRMGQLLRFRLKVPDHPKGLPAYDWMATTFVDAVRDCLKAGGFAKKDNEAETGGVFLVGYRGRLYFVGDDYQVGVAAGGVDAVGCGWEIARGALYATRGQEPKSRVLTALRAAEAYSAGVRGPFVVLESE